MRALALIGVVLCVVVVRVVLESRAELLDAERLERSGDLDGAIIHYRRAAQWYVPLSPFPGHALDRLATHARRLEHGGDVARALAAWRAIRASVMSIRSFYTPFSSHLATADEHIAGLMAMQDPPPIDAAKTRTEIRRDHLEQLRHTARPRLLFSLMTLVGFAAFVAGVLAFVLRGIDAEDRLVPREARRWGAVAVVGFVAFVLGMHFG